SLVSGDEVNFEVSNISINVSGAKDFDYNRPVISNFVLSKTASAEDCLIWVCSLNKEFKSAIELRF
ncbi:MAG: hypothetical protein RL124_740, partial [Acidobacteriota bacterium]